MNELFLNLKRHIELSEEEQYLIETKARLENYEKKQILEDYQTIYKHIYFVKEGCIQLCTTNDNGTEQTIQFSIKDWWITDFDSFNYQKKSFYQLKTVQKTTVIKFTKTDLDTLKTNIPQLEKYFRIIAERAYAASLYRISLMLSMPKEERYFHYIQHFYKFVENVPQYILASYLGLSPEYLSEIKKKVNNLKLA